MASNYVLIERIELNASTASITFANIPQTGYTDLKIVASMRCSTANTAAAIRFNNDTASNYSSKRLGGDSTAAYSGSTSSITQLQWLIIPFASATANTYGNAEIYIPNYLSTSNTKSLSFDSVSENNSTAKDAANIELNAGLWSKTPEAINSVTILSGGGDLVAGSTFSLYGVAALGTTPTIAPKATGGNTITTDGTYWYHAFLSSGTFTPLSSLSCDILTIAGGGAGGRGGGGAGGLVYASAQTVAASAQTITIGAGGAQRTSDGAGLSNPGSNSQFASLTAAVGGGAAAGYSVNGGTGGSGGGAGWGNGSYSGGSATSGQGNAGGNNGNGDCGGGGGGAGATGANGATGNPGVGGAGLSTYSSWGSATGTGQNVTGTYWFAGGGGASGNTSQSNRSGGNGGGGTGVSSVGGTPTAGTANTGGGGGGGSGSTAIGGAAGGSGIIIVRYAV